MFYVCILQSDPYKILFNWVNLSDCELDESAPPSAEGIPPLKSL